MDGPRVQLKTSKERAVDDFKTSVLSVIVSILNERFLSTYWNYQLKLHPFYDWSNLECTQNCKKQPWWRYLAGRSYNPSPPKKKKKKIKKQNQKDCP